MKKNNIDVRLAIFNSDFTNYEIAFQCGMSEATFYRRMRNPLNEEDKNRILSAIEELKKGVSTYEAR